MWRFVRYVAEVYFGVADALRAISEYHGWDYRGDVVRLGTAPSEGAIRENGQVVAVTRLVR